MSDRYLPQAKVTRDDPGGKPVFVEEIEAWSQEDLILQLLKKGYIREEDPTKHCFSCGVECFDEAFTIDGNRYCPPCAEDLRAKQQVQSETE
jgi:hypothetical protein